MRSAAEWAQRLARRAMIDVAPFDHRTHPLARRARLLDIYGIDTILDVGANSGQYAQQLRALGYRGRIISFEPLSAAFVELRRNQAKHPQGWEISNVAVGDRTGRAVLNISANSYSSSLLPMLSTCVDSAPNARFVAQEEVTLETLNSIIESRIDRAARLFVKSDTQGYESAVLAGAGESLDRILGFQVEMSLVPLYEGEMLFLDMIHYLGERGFTLMSLEPGFANPLTGQLLQADGVFFRT
jgi:FkbM family methyltransferase